jgi:squalene cyclase
MTEQEIIKWLLDGDTAIRWQVMRDLLGESEAAFIQERMRIASQGWGADLLSHQDPSGKWAGQLYNTKWISTTYTMQLLRRMGLDPDNHQAQKACQQLLEGGYKESGAISFAKTVPTIDLGVAGLVLSVLAYFGYPDSRVHTIVEFLLDQQLPDGSWLPEPNLKSLQYIFAATMLILEGLHEYEKRYPDSSAQVVAAQIKGREFLLQHHMYKSRDAHEIVDPKFTRFSFPPRWHYNVLVALDYFQDCDADKDERLNDAIALVRSKRRKDGRWNLQNRHPGKTYFEMEEVGKPSRWNTLRALRVLNWWDEL